MKNTIILILAIFFASQSLLFAQRDGNRKQFREGDTRQFRDSIDLIMKQKIVENLGIDQTTADKFLATYKENNQKIRMLNKEKKDLMKSIESDPSASDMESKLNSMLDLESRMVDQRRSFFAELRSFLTPQQIAGTMIFRKNFDRKLRKEIMGQRKRGKIRDKDKRKDP